MKLLSNALIVVGFCLGTAGAAGFHEPTDPEYKAENPNAKTEEWALPLFIVGLVGVVSGCLLRRAHDRSQRAAEDSQTGGLKGVFKGQLESIRDMVIELDEKKNELSTQELCGRIDKMFRNEYFDLTARNEDYARLLGFTDYARVWEGVATAERQIARTWSMATDGYPEQGIEELPLARKNLEHACEVLATL